MRIPINWLKEYVTLPEKQDELTHKLTMAGHMLDKVDQKHGTTVLDLELRGNRADCYSILGIAREVSALFSTPLTYPKTYPALKKVKQLSTHKLEVKTELVKRVMMVAIKNVTITESPRWLKDKIESYGMTSLNNIVDLTNFVMIETGQPMHAFDLEKTGNTLQIRLAKKGEKMTTFLGKDIELTHDDLVWANEKEVLSVAGAIGGKHHSITNDTKHILLEAANYDRANIRRSIHRLNLLTDAGIRHEKDLDPNLVSFGIYRFLELLTEHGWGEIEKEIFDFYPIKVDSWKLKLSYEYLKTLSGLEIPKKEVKSILESLQFEIVKDTAQELEVLVPTYRTDVTLEEDLIEEILRIYSYDQIPTQTLSLSIPDDVTPNFIKQEKRVRNAFVELGFDEVISLPFVRKDFLSLNTSFPDKPVSPVTILNRPSPDFEYLRMSMFPNLYEFTKKIMDERGTMSYIFEVGKVYTKKGSEYTEKRKVGCIYWEKDASFAKFKGLLDGFFQKLFIQNVKYKVVTREMPVLLNSFSIHVKTDMVGIGGIYKNMYFVEIDLDSVLEKEGKPKATLWSKYPPQIEDLTLLIPDKTHIGELVDSMKEEKAIHDVQLITVYDNAYTFRLWYQDEKKTLQDKEVEEVRKKILDTLHKKYNVRVKS